MQNRPKRSPSFTKVYEAAKAGTAQALTNMKEFKTANINVKNGFPFGLLTPAGLLQMENNQPAVALLLGSGADVDYVGYGAALGNHVEAAEFYRKYHGANPNLLAQGAAYAGNFEYAKKLLKHGASKMSVILGSFMGKDNTKDNINVAIAGIKDIRSIITADDWHEIAMTIGMTYGSMPSEFASGFEKINATYEIDKWILYGAGIAGHSVAETVSEFDVSLGKLAPYEQGIILGGHFGYFENKTPDFNNLAFLYAAQGNHTSFDAKYAEMIKDTDYEIERHKGVHYSNDIASMMEWRKNHLLSAFNDRHIASLDGLSFKMLSQYYSQTSYRGLFDKLSIKKLLPNENIALHALTFNDNEDFKDRLIAIAKNESNILPYNFLNVVSAANKLHQMMRKYEFSYDQALALLKSSELRKFVFALCKDVTNEENGIPFKVRAIFVKQAGNLDLKDAEGLLKKIHRFRFVTKDLLVTLHEIDAEASSAETKHEERLTSLSAAMHQNLHHPDSKNIFLSMLCQQLTLIDKIKEMKKQEAVTTQSTWGVTSALNTTSALISKAKRKTIGLFVKSDVPKHEQEFDGLDENDRYETLIKSNFQRLRG